MTVLLITDVANNDIQNYSIVNQQECIYKQLKELKHDLSSSVTLFSIVEFSPSIFGKVNKHYRQHRRRRRCRSQQCLVQHLLTYMLILLILINRLHWPVIFLSLSSIKLMSTHASTTTMAATTTTTIITSSNPTTTVKRPLVISSATRTLSKDDEQQCLPIDHLQINRICSKTCRSRTTPFEKYDNTSQLGVNLHHLPFCSNVLSQTIVKENFFNETTEYKCREKLNQILKFDEEARKASILFATYIQAIDSGSGENRYSIITSNCEVDFRSFFFFFF